MNLDYLAITDHDTLSSSNRAHILGERYGVNIIPAVELSAWDKKRNEKVHILCYAPQKPDRLEGLCLKSCSIRTECAKDMINKVMERYPIPPDAVRMYTKGSKSIFKQHIMRALCNYGYATELYGETNNRLFSYPDGECLVQREYPDVNFVLDLIHSSRGVAVMAHPYLFGGGNIELLDELIESKKLDGIEVFHYSADEDKQRYLLEKCGQNGLIATGGSDFHGLYNSVPTHIGSSYTDDVNIKLLLAKIAENKQRIKKSAVVNNE